MYDVRLQVLIGMEMVQRIRHRAVDERKSVSELVRGWIEKEMGVSGEVCGVKECDDCVKEKGG